MCAYIQFFRVGSGCSRLSLGGFEWLAAHRGERPARPRDGVLPLARAFSHALFIREPDSRKLLDIPKVA